MNRDTYVAKDFIVGFITPNFLEKRNISRGAKHLYGLLCDYAGTKDHCWPAHKTLATRMSCSVSSIKNYLAQLVAQELICVTKDPTRRIRSCIYYLLTPSEFTQKKVRPHKQKDSTKTLPTSQNLTSQNLPRVQTKFGYNLNLTEAKKIHPIAPASTASPVGAKNISHSKNTRAHAHGGGGSASANTQIQKTRATDSSFDAFYSLYPRKEGKRAAQKAWSRLQKQGRLPPHETLQQAIAHASDSQQWKKEEGRYIPMPAKYLLDERWQDIADTDIIDHKAKTAQEITRENIVQATLERVESNKNADKDLKEALRPSFNRLLSHFMPSDSASNHAPTFGYFIHLHKKGLAPQEKHVPRDAKKRYLFDWLREYARNIPSVTQQ